jgi:hypothetical protein
MDPNFDIVPTLRMFDGVMMGKAADEIERLRAEVAALKAKAADAPVAYAAQFDLDVLTTNQESHKMRLRRCSHGSRTVPLYAAPQPAAETVTLTQQAFDAMRVALEVIAVGDSLTPTATAAHGLVASGFWTDTLESKAADAPGMAEPVGKAVPMPGASGFTMAVFDASEIPVGTDLYAAPQPVAQTEFHICGECDRQFKTGESAQPLEQTRALTVDAVQQKAIDHGFKYWRAPDAHGVTATNAQAVDLLQDLLGVEVEIEAQAERALTEVGFIVHDDVHGWHFAPTVAWTYLGKGRALYTLTAARPASGDTE